MSTNITHADVTPPAAPAHRCINTSCGCNDLVSAGACCEWCMANTVEYADVVSGKAEPVACHCEHATCLANAGAPVETAQRGMA